jgi:hypothetical protein
MAIVMGGKYNFNSNIFFAYPKNNIDTKKQWG